ncbi:MAG: hypothetical protein WKF90_12910 [Pyrinomonadaceae bacterium]
MNRTVQISRIKLTIFFVTSLFAMTLLIQSTAYGQIVRPGSPLIITGKPTIRPDISNRLLPDLQIADIQMDLARCTLRVLVANTGLTDAGAFDVWLDIGTPIPMFFKHAQTMDRLESNKDAWLSFDFTIDPGHPSSSCKLQVNQWGPPYMGETLHAVADPRYLKLIVLPPSSPSTIFAAGDLIKSGSRDKDINGNSFTVSEPRVRETDENNNELVMKRADIKSYSAPPAIRKHP